jgi:GTPase SAR1 family protein
VLLGRSAELAAAGHAVHHTTGKIVLLGDHSVGKSALGYRLIHGAFKEQASQQRSSGLPALFDRHYLRAPAG